MSFENSLSSLRVQQELARFEYLVTEGSISDVQKMAGLPCLQWSCALTPAMASAMKPPPPPPCPGAPLRPPCMTPAMSPVPPKVKLPKKNVPQPTNL
ncbi:disheveled-associated activator of morphogenesis 1-like isoform X2 [Drosophila serrata]|uniref:disheveled-associated activator of morphogenesis 1-like isoform X2 n=1 Tax=Drosophila serrata TaxID=7274 RepID=UPI000A1D23F9|nr:disheveled-associated activator of morphogenesis 1-like isoform X2 [Drosophila serrata]